MKSVLKNADISNANPQAAGGRLMTISCFGNMATWAENSSAVGDTPLLFSASVSGGCETYFRKQTMSTKPRTGRNSNHSYVRRECQRHQAPTIKIEQLCIVHIDTFHEPSFPGLDRRASVPSLRPLSRVARRPPPGIFPNKVLFLSSTLPSTSKPLAFLLHPVQGFSTVSALVPQPSSISLEGRYLFACVVRARVKGLSGRRSRCHAIPEELDGLAR